MDEFRICFIYRLSGERNKIKMITSMLSQLQEVEELTVGIDEGKLFRRACEKVGVKYETFVDMKSAEMITSAEVVTKYGPAPLLPSGKVNPWPKDGLWELSVIVFVTSVHGDGRGYCGNELMSLNAIETVEGQLRAMAYRKCEWTDDTTKRTWAKGWLGRKRVQKMTAVTSALARKHGAKIMEDRTVKYPLYCYDVDFVHEKLQAVTDDVERAMVGEAIVALTALSGKRRSSLFKNVDREKGLRDTAEKREAVGKPLQVYLFPGLELGELQLSPWIDKEGRHRVEIHFKYQHWKGLTFGSTKMRFASMTPAPSHIPIEKDNAAVFLRYLWRRGVFVAQIEAKAAGKTEEEQFDAVFGTEAALASFNEDPGSAMPVFRLQIASEFEHSAVFLKVDKDGFVHNSGLTAKTVIPLVQHCFESICHLPPYKYSMYSLRKAILDQLQLWVGFDVGGE